MNGSIASDCEYVHATYNLQTPHRNTHEGTTTYKRLEGCGRRYRRLNMPCIFGVAQPPGQSAIGVLPEAALVVIFRSLKGPIETHGFSRVRSLCYNHLRMFVVWRLNLESNTSHEDLRLRHSNRLQLQDFPFVSLPTVVLPLPRCSG